MAGVGHDAGAGVGRVHLGVGERSLQHADDLVRIFRQTVMRDADRFNIQVFLLQFFDNLFIALYDCFRAAAFDIGSQCAVNHFQVGFDVQ